MKHLAIALLASAARRWSPRHPPGPARTAASGPTQSMPTLPTQLPRTAIPSHYAIEVTPHADQLTFDGKVAIDLKVIKPTRDAGAQRRRPQHSRPPR